MEKAEDNNLVYMNLCLGDQSFAISFCSGIKSIKISTCDKTNQAWIAFSSNANTSGLLCFGHRRSGITGTRIWGIHAPGEENIGLLSPYTIGNRGTRAGYIQPEYE